MARFDSVSAPISEIPQRAATSAALRARYEAGEWVSRAEVENHDLGKMVIGGIWHVNVCLVRRARGG